MSCFGTTLQVDILEERSVALSDFLQTESGNSSAPIDANPPGWPASAQNFTDLNFTKVNTSRRGQYTRLKRTSLPSRSFDV